ncbi:hypothetical protein [Pseudomonas sp. PS01299]|uniref:hypothetical protein n=1 Tax=Pseudomonas sp. PS01299 TaxID=2991435 RepID=UPI00249B476D|nr:hypothetical protein [Pseudomonas sp. PS01299]
MQENYRKLEGMRFEFVSGSVAKESDHIACTFTFKAMLDFTHFVHMSNAYVPGYLDSYINAIKPRLDGVAHHSLYNRFNSAAGNIGTVEELVRVFSSPNNYSDTWSSNGTGLLARYHKPQFHMVGDQLQVTGGQDFRWEVEPEVERKIERKIEPQDVPDIYFVWALSVLKAYPEDPFHQPEEIVTLGDSEEALVDVGGKPIRKGTRYLVGRDLRLGAINPEQILTAGYP